ncbi:MAG: AAA family ATPase [Microlunatus sp.]
MLTQLQMVNFKGFQKFTATFRGDAVLVGPNNAGKSTLIAALKIANLAARTAMRQKPTVGENDGKRDVVAHRIQRPDVVGVLEENVRHEFLDEQTSVSLTFDRKATVHVVWPPDEQAFAWIEHPKGQLVTTARQAKILLHSASFVPTLAPVEHQEKRLTETYLRENIETRLFSRHFRNQIALARDKDRSQYEQLIDYLLARSPELASLELCETFEDATYLEAYSGHPNRTKTITPEVRV